MSKPIRITEKEAKNLEQKVNPTPVKTKTLQVQVAGNAVVLTSKLKFDTIQKMEKYNRDALCLFDVVKDEEVEVFRIATGKVGSISNYGIVFSEADKNGCARTTIMLPEGVTDKTAFIKDNFAGALFMLADLEAVVETATAELEQKYAELDNYIKEI